MRAGDPAPDGSGPLELARGVEIGHIFQLGRKYAEALDLKVLDENGKQVVVTMGSYGVGVTRSLALLAENNNDELGLKWPIQVAPYHVHIVATGKEDAVFDASRCAGRRARGRRCRGLLRRPPQGISGREIQGRGTPWRAIHSGGWPGPRNRRR